MASTRKTDAARRKLFRLLTYAGGIAGIAFLLRWLEFQYLVRRLPTEFYVLLIAVLFTSLGIWIGNRVTRAPAPDVFEKNSDAIEALGISEREYDVLLLLADGHTNLEIADRLFVSPNTVKTHVANLYLKLDVSRRSHAASKARSLRLIP